MSKICGKGNATTEIAVLNEFRNEGIKGWRRHVKQVPGTPDFVFKENKIAVFLDGCFWHGCGICKSGKIPTNNREFWLKKIKGNQKRD